MSQPFKLRYQNEIVGLFVVGAFVSVLVAGLLLARGGATVGDGFECEVVFHEPGVAALRPGLSVRMNSQRVGVVTGSGVDARGFLRAQLRFLKELQAAVPVDSVAVLYTPMAGLAGETYLEIAVGKASERLAIGGELEGRVAGDLVQLATDVLRDLRGGLGPSLEALTRISVRGERMLARVEHVMALPESATALDALLARADAAATRAERTLAAVEALLGRLDGTLDKTDAALAGAVRLVTKVERGEGLIGRALADPALERRVLGLLDKMNASLVAVDRLLAQTGRAAAAAPEMMEQGRAALRDMAVVATELRRIAPAVPSMTAQIDELLGEGRAVLGAVERHWLLGAQLRPKGPPTALPVTGLRDAEPAVDLDALRAALAPRGEAAR